MGHIIAYNVGNPYEELSIKELANLLAASYSDRKILVQFKKQENQTTGYKVNRIIPNVDKLYMLGWLPKIGVVEGFKRAISWYE